MKKYLRKLFLAILVVEIIALSMASRVVAAGNASLDVSIKPDTSDVITNKRVYFNISFVNVQNIDTSKPMALSGSIEFDPNILSNPTINVASNWSAGMANNKVLLDCMAFTANKTIATIVFDVNFQNNVNTATKIALTNVEISNSENYDVTKARIESDEAIILSLQHSNGSSSGNDSEINVINQNGNDTIKESSTKTGDKDDNDGGGFNLTISKNLIGSGTSNQTILQESTPSSTNRASQQKVNTIEPVKDATTSNSPIPQTGASYVIYIVMGIIIIIGIYTFIRDKKFYD